MMINTVIAFLLSAISAAIFTPLTISFAKKIGVMDIPNDSRKIQAVPMPRLGGLSFIASFLISCLFVFLTFDVPDNINLLGFFVGAGIVAATGFIDDAFGLKPWMKLLRTINCSSLCNCKSELEFFMWNFHF